MDSGEVVREMEGAGHVHELVAYPGGSPLMAAAGLSGIT